MNQDLSKEESAVREIVERWARGWREWNAEVATQDYAEDADWINAFGISRKGRTQIHNFLARGFARPDGRQVGPSIITVRFIRPDVAIVSSYHETTGQQRREGGVYPTRRTHGFRVLVKEGGRWLIVSHLIMDEKEP